MMCVRLIRQRVVIVWSLCRPGYASYANWKHFGSTTILLPQNGCLLLRPSCFPDVMISASRREGHLMACTTLSSQRQTPHQSGVP